MFVFSSDTLLASYEIPTGSPQNQVILTLPSGMTCPPKRSVIILDHVISDRENVSQGNALDAVVTMYCSTNGGASFDTGNSYDNNGLRVWDGGVWPPTAALGGNYIDPIEEPQTQNLGCRINLDCQDTVNRGTNALISLSSRGTVSGHNVSTAYTAIVNKGSNTSPRSVPIFYTGFYYGADGHQVNALMFRLDGGGKTSGQESYNFVSGHFEWRC